MSVVFGINFIYAECVQIWTTIDGLDRPNSKCVFFYWSLNCAILIKGYELCFQFNILLPSKITSQSWLRIETSIKQSSDITQLCSTICLIWPQITLQVAINLLWVLAFVCSHKSSRNLPVSNFTVRFRVLYLLYEYVATRMMHLIIRFWPVKHWYPIPESEMEYNEPQCR